MVGFQMLLIKVWDLVPQIWLIRLAFKMIQNRMPPQAVKTRDVCV